MIKSKLGLISFINFVSRDFVEAQVNIFVYFEPIHYLHSQKWLQKRPEAGRFWGISPNARGLSYKPVFFLGIYRAGSFTKVFIFIISFRGLDVFTVSIWMHCCSLGKVLSHKIGKKKKVGNQISQKSVYIALLKFCLINKKFYFFLS